MRLRISQMPDTFQYSSNDSTVVIVIPDPGEQILRIKFREKDKTTIWVFYISRNNVPQVDALIELRKFIISIIEFRPEYKILPSARLAIFK